MAAKGAHCLCLPTPASLPGKTAWSLHAAAIAFQAACCQTLSKPAKPHCGYHQGLWMLARLRTLGYGPWECDAVCKCSSEKKVNLVIVSSKHVSVRLETTSICTCVTNCHFIKLHSSHGKHFQKLSLPKISPWRLEAWEGGKTNQPDLF